MEGKKKIVRNYKYKLITTRKQDLIFEKWLETCRTYWNISLELWQWLYTGTGKGTSAYALMSEYKDIPKLEGCEWMQDCPADTRNDVARSLEKSYKAFFRNIKRRRSGKASKDDKVDGPPTFASKKRFRTFHIRQKGKSALKIERKDSKRATVIIPKLGKVRMNYHRDVEGKVKCALVTKASDGWYICFSCERFVDEIKPDSKKIISKREIGIDWGVRSFLTFSNGDKIAVPDSLANKHKELVVLQQKISSKKLGGKNRKKAVAVYVKAQEKHTRAKDHFLHTLSKQISDKFDIVYIEDISIIRLTKSAKGTVENPGKDVKKKSNLNRKILSMPFYKFCLMLSYKLDEKDGLLVKNNPAYTSQECNECGSIHEKNRKSQSEFVCLSCGHENDADINASQNQIKRGRIKLRDEQIEEAVREEMIAAGSRVQ